MTNVAYRVISGLVCLGLSQFQHWKSNVPGNIWVPGKATGWSLAGRTLGWGGSGPLSRLRSEAQHKVKPAAKGVNCRPDMLIPEWSGQWKVISGEQVLTVLKREDMAVTLWVPLWILWDITMLYCHDGWFTQCRLRSLNPFFAVTYIQVFESVLWT